MYFKEMSEIPLTGPLLFISVSVFSVKPNVETYTNLEGGTSHTTSLCALRGFYNV